MIHPSHPGDPVEWAALYASGALTAPERREFETHLATGCPTCQAALAEYDEVVATLGEAIEPDTPPDNVRSGLMARAASLSARETLRDREPPVKAEAPPHAGSAGLTVRRTGDAQWSETGHAGVQIRMLYVDHQRRQFTSLVRMSPGSSYPPHSHAGAEECLVLDGDLRFGNQVLSRGDFLRTEPGYEQVVQTTEAGCLLYLTSPFE